MDFIPLEDDRVLQERCFRCGALLYCCGGGYETISGYIGKYCADLLDRGPNLSHTEHMALLHEGRTPRMISFLKEIGGYARHRKDPV